MPHVTLHESIPGSEDLMARADVLAALSRVRMAFCTHAGIRPEKADPLELMGSVLDELGASPLERVEVLSACWAVDETIRDLFERHHSDLAEDATVEIGGQHG